MFARIGFTFVNIAEASSIKVSSGTLASKSVDEIYTNTSVSAWIGGTFVDVIFTMSTSESRNTFTYITEMGEIN